MMINDVDFPEDVKTKICKNGLFDEDFYLYGKNSPTKKNTFVVTLAKFYKVSLDYITGLTNKKR